MKKLYFLPFFALSFGHFQAKAQASFNTMDSVDINKLHATVLVHGDMWWDPVTQAAMCHYPGSVPRSIHYAGSIWMAANDGAGQVHAAAQTYRQDGSEYWPGPLDANDTLTYATSENWAKIWKVNRTDIQHFQAMTVHTLSNTSQVILEWPGKGNVYAKGNAGAALAVSHEMAPFVDINSNGVYEPLLGEYPDVPGDQSLWWVFSDNGPGHDETHRRALGVEIHAMSYAYNRGTLIDNVVYYDYVIVNRSANNYHDFRIAQRDDVDLGYYLDDYIGFDSVWRMGIGYNGTNNDGQGGGHPLDYYGMNPPQSAVTMIVLPGDVGTNYVPAGSFVSYDVDFLITGHPLSDTQISYYLHAKDFNGLPIDSFTHAPPCSVTNSNYIFPGDPSDTTAWSECSCNDNPGDRRFILSSGGFTLNAGSSEHAVFALIVADSAGGGCTSFNKIRIVADTAWHIYHHPLAPLPLSVADNATANPVRIYPNPAHDKLYIQDNARNTYGAHITVYNIIGQKMNILVGNSGQQFELDISQLPKGLYNVLYRNGNVQTNTKFRRE